MVKLSIHVEEDEANELLALLSFWFDHDGLLSGFVLEAAREVAGVSREILKEKLNIPATEDTVVLGNLSAKTQE